jgi:hypothetical protein
MIAMIATPNCVMLLSCFAVALGVVTESMAQARPPQILEISRDYLKPDAVAENRKLERRAEHLCRVLGFYSEKGVPFRAANNGDPPLNGTVFEMKDGSRMLVRTTQTSSGARVLAASAGSTARIFRSYFYFRPKDM